MGCGCSLRAKDGCPEDLEMAIERMSHILYSVMVFVPWWELFPVAKLKRRRIMGMMIMIIIILFYEQRIVM